MPNKLAYPTVKIALEDSKNIIQTFLYSYYNIIRI